MDAALHIDDIHMPAADWWTDATWVTGLLELLYQNCLWFAPTGLGLGSEHRPFKSRDELVAHIGSMAAGSLVPIGHDPTGGQGGVVWLELKERCSLVVSLDAPALAPVRSDVLDRMIAFTGALYDELHVRARMLARAYVPVDGTSFRRRSEPAPFGPPLRWGAAPNQVVNAFTKPFLGADPPLGNHALMDKLLAEPLPDGVGRDVDGWFVTFRWVSDLEDEARVVA